MSELEIQVGATIFRVPTRPRGKLGAGFLHLPCGEWFNRFGPLPGKQTSPHTWLTHPCPGITPFDLQFPHGRALWRAVWEQGERLWNGNG